MKKIFLKCCFEFFFITSPEILDEGSLEVYVYICEKLRSTKKGWSLEQICKYSLRFRLCSANIVDKIAYN